jgi:hypothetical protein
MRKSLTMVVAALLLVLGLAAYGVAQQMPQGMGGMMGPGMGQGQMGPQGMGPGAMGGEQGRGMMDMMQQMMGMMQQMMGMAPMSPEQRQAMVAQCQQMMAQPPQTPETPKGQ